MKIVIADDSALLRARIKELIEDYPELECIGEAQNGNDAIQVIRDSNPDLVLLDIRMPGLSGIEVLKLIKSEGLSTKVCVLTHYPYKQYKDRCLAEGADYFFDKNNDIQKIIELLAGFGSENGGATHD
ncbi:response regulator transcription factor [Bacteroidota bacterium]